MSIATLMSATLVAQTDAQISNNQLTADEKKALIKETQTIQYVPGNKMSCPQTDSLVTQLAAGNEFSGNMFDVVIGPNDLLVKTFWVSHDIADQVSVYYKTGTFVGNETNAAAWTYLDSGLVAANGAGMIDPIPVDLALTLSAGQTYGFYVTNNNQTGFLYTNGTTVGTPWASNADLTINEGNGGDIFDVTFSPRNFNGAIEYCVMDNVGLEDLTAEDLNIYPNPANAELNIDLSGLQINNSSVAIYNLLGELVLQNDNLSVTSNNIINISNLDSGMYVVTINADGKALSTKVLVD